MAVALNGMLKLAKSEESKQGDLNALFPHELAAGLLSPGLLSGPARHAVPALALDRSAVADTQVERLPTTTDTPGDIVAVITVMDMATVARIMAKATIRPY